MSERLTWEEIQERYPDQWVGLAEVEYEPDNDATIKTAIVKYTDKSKNELTRMQIQTNGNLPGIYTTPDHVFQMGQWGISDEAIYIEYEYKIPDRIPEFP